ncbi:MAG: hypothetical protein DLM54_12145, partial [Acidimicrobiales bacterium]
MMVGRYLPSFAAAIPPRGSNPAEAPESAGSEESLVADKPITIQRAWRGSQANGPSRPIMLAIAGD